MEDGKLWLVGGGCRHDWKLGPVTDRLMRRRPAVCVKCWAYEEGLDLSVWNRYEVWTTDLAAQYETEVEEHFGLRAV